MSDSEFSTISVSASIHDSATIQHPVNIGRNAEVHAFTKIGSFTFINQYSVVYGRTSIGKFCTIARNCEIGVASHPIDWISTLGNMQSYFPKHPHIGKAPNFPMTAHQPTSIGNDVWLGCGVVIKSGVTIGNGAIVAASAVVNSDIEPYSIYGGIPARFIRLRFPIEIIDELEDLQWWNLPTDVIASLPRNDISECIRLIKEIKSSKQQ